MIRREVHYKSYLLPSFAERPGHVDAMFRATVAAGAADLAVIDGDRRIDYGALDATVGRIAGNLARLGVGAGDRVAIVLGNKAEFIAASLACARLGAIQVPINIRQRKPENTYVLDHSGAVALIHDAELHDRMPDPADVPALSIRRESASNSMIRVRRLFPGADAGRGAAAVRRRSQPRQCHETSNQPAASQTADVLPGIEINTSPTNYHPIRQLHMMRFDGTRWALFDDLTGG